jgi:antitoxin CptB
MPLVETSLFPYKKLMENESSAPSIEALRRKLAFRSWHRGTREMDLLLGRFADAMLQGLSEGDLRLYSDLLAENDPDLYEWLMGKSPPPEPFAALLEKMRNHLMFGAAR